MSTVAKYTFNSEDSYYAAVERIKETDVGLCGRDWDCEYKTIWIYDNHNNPAVVGKICQAHGGEACN
jgi:hypothetical protein